MVYVLTTGMEHSKCNFTTYAVGIGSYTLRHDKPLHGIRFDQRSNGGFFRSEQ